MNDLKSMILSILDDKPTLSFIPAHDLYILKLIRSATEIASQVEHTPELKTILSYLKSSISKLTPLGPAHDACILIGQNTPILPPPVLNDASILISTRPSKTPFIKSARAQLTPPPPTPIK